MAFQTFAYGAQKLRMAVLKLALSKSSLSERLADAWDDEISVLANDDMPDTIWFRVEEIKASVRSIDKPTDAERFNVMPCHQLQQIISDIIEIAFETETARAFAAEQGAG